MILLQSETVVIISDVDWDGHWVCEQQIASILSEKNKVLYIEQTRTLLACFRRSGGDTSFLKKLKLIKQGVRRINTNLYVVSLPFILPFRYVPFIYFFNQKLLLYFIQRVFKQLNIYMPVIISFEPDSGKLINAINNKFVVYYRNDNHDKRGLWFNPDYLVSKRETELMKNVNFVCTLSNGFAKKSEFLNLKTYVLPNGVNTDLFSASLDANNPEPSDISIIPHPRIGVVGMLDWRTDIRLIEWLARRHKDWSLVLVGPVSIAARKIIQRCKSHGNIFFLGPKTVSEVPSYMKALDVGLIPYIINQYTKDILSLKIFEYSAVGVPTVCTPMPELIRYSENLHFTRDAHEFESCISQCLNDHDDSWAQRLIEFAHENTWRKRTEQLAEIIYKELDLIETNGRKI